WECVASCIIERYSFLRQALPALFVRIPPEPWSIYYDYVSFSYSGANRYAAHRISLTIEPGEVIAIVGRNGAGKSTLIDLLVRFYDPTSGRIMIGGVDLREWNLDVWREAVGLMSQEVFLFHATIAENIAYAKRAATEAEIIA